MYFLLKEVLSLFKALDVIHGNVLFENVWLFFVFEQVSIFSKGTFADMMPIETYYYRKRIDENVSTVKWATRWQDNATINRQSREKKYRFLYILLPHTKFSKLLKSCNRHTIRDLGINVSF